MPASTQNLLPALQRLYDTRRWYELIVRAHRDLALTADAPELVHLTLRALVELGLGGPALELLQLRRDLGRSAADRATLRSSLAAVPNGRVAWSDLEGVFQKNLAALAANRPQWHDAEPRLRAALTQVQLHRSRLGHCLLSRRAPGMLREWLLDLSALELEPGLRAALHGQRHATVVVGARVAPLLAQVYEQTRHVELWYSPPLYLVEPDGTAFAAWLHCADHTAWLSDPRVYVLVGPDAVDQCVRLWERNRRLALPARLADLAPHERTGADVHAAVRQHADRDNAECEQLRRQLEERYAARDAAYWAERFRAPGTILGITSRFTTMLRYSTRDALAALAAQGYQTEMLIETCDHELLRPGDFFRTILDLDPLLIIAIDHARHEVPYIPRNLPYLLWIQDPLPELLCRQAGASVGPFDLVCGYYEARCTQELDYPADRFLPVTVPVSTSVFHDGPLDADAAAQYAADVCYVGHGGQPLEAHYQAAVARRNPALRSRLAVVYDRVRRVLSGAESVAPTATMDELVQSLATVDGIALHEFAYRLLDVGRRQQTLEWVAAWARRTGRVFRIYGRGWEEHPTLRDFAAGVIEHGEPLRRAYRAATLSLQLMPSGYLHQRAFEALASGCLPLTRYCPADFAGRSIDAYLVERPKGWLATSNAAVMPRLERVVFSSAEEFGALAEQYLADAPRRQHVLAELREVVVRDFTYGAAMGRIVDAFRGRLERAAADAQRTRSADARARNSS
jgi:hypothetical protein